MFTGLGKCRHSEQSCYVCITNLLFPEVSYKHSSLLVYSNLRAGRDFYHHQLHSLLLSILFFKGHPEDQIQPTGQTNLLNKQHLLQGGGVLRSDPSGSQRCHLAVYKGRGYRKDHNQSKTLLQTIYSSYQSCYSQHLNQSVYYGSSGNLLIKTH